LEKLALLYRQDAGFDAGMTLPTAGMLTEQRARYRKSLAEDLKVDPAMIELPRGHAAERTHHHAVTN
jgi:predicted metal-dependent hydrolase